MPLQHHGEKLPAEAPRPAGVAAKQHCGSREAPPGQHGSGGVCHQRMGTALQGHPQFCIDSYRHRGVAPVLRGHSDCSRRWHHHWRSRRACCSQCCLRCRSSHHTHCSRRGHHHWRSRRACCSRRCLRCRSSDHSDWDCSRRWHHHPPCLLQPALHPLKKQGPLALQPTLAPSLAQPPCLLRPALPPL